MIQNLFIVLIIKIIALPLVISKSFGNLLLE